LLVRKVSSATAELYGVISRLCNVVRCDTTYGVRRERLDC